MDKCYLKLSLTLQHFHLRLPLVPLRQLVHSLQHLLTFLTIQSDMHSCSWILLRHYGNTNHLQYRWMLYLCKRYHLRLVLARQQFHHNAQSNLHMRYSSPFQVGIGNLYLLSWIFSELK